MVWDAIDTKGLQRTIYELRYTTKCMASITAMRSYACGHESTAAWICRAGLLYRGIISWRIHHVRRDRAEDPLPTSLVSKDFFYSTTCHQDSRYIRPVFGPLSMPRILPSARLPECFCRFRDCERFVRVQGRAQEWKS